MLVTEVTNALPGGSSLLRNEPVQARSSARLAGLLDAAAAVIDEIGFERLTTAMVAERAGASIGTVYRYFPDRIAVVEALAIRCTQRLASRFVEALDASGAEIWQDANDALIDLTAEMYRTEPGFRAIRFGDPADTGTGDAEDRMGALGATVGQIMRDRFGLPDDERITRAWVVLAESGHAVLARAHRDREHPDTELIEEYRRMNRAHLESVIAAS
ncbi:TetR family transcriptional regulator [Curtobacterium flaccumfaciens]|uniref:TetR family transcriptional regulator n=1 Tax=Curtobacterium poinsettiae TaxID=159612 RepID=A0A9Q9P6H3_9MICO|nr:MULTISPECIES: TetR/AcrR family transcriptional regulator [Curtobacterium]MBO9040503.1 TetR family transcriptional regulator [Curtobacterium flaccumfaciens pv. flaccumfaciens]MCS6560416.1 TetR family transcriptional regulator [Curtobacterium flaccumfaciens pv. poinsettiae]MDT0234574.1 TetR/AcrR family transcriptional regulator [Curtobacterium sp. BRB10]UXN24642.1 TetR family transcriptional regulator [Curtobacterium flaccumfaciens]UXN27417.1 TetR family transcriptional regulator [Curtobacter